MVSGETSGFCAAGGQGIVMLVAAAAAALRAIRRMASVRLFACWSVRCRLGMGGSGGKSAGGASCGGGVMAEGQKAAGGAGHGGAEVSG